jgi:endonuclease YncB( thermonuclease family)
VTNELGLDSLRPGYAFIATVYISQCVKLYFFFSSSSHALTGKVTSVADGDTITILDSSNKQFKIFLYGIDCSEKGQAFGEAAKSTHHG